MEPDVGEACPLRDTPAPTAAPEPDLEKDNEASLLLGHDCGIVVVQGTFEADFQVEDGVAAGFLKHDSEGAGAGVTRPNSTRGQCGPRRARQR